GARSGWGAPPRWHRRRRTGPRGAVGEAAVARRPVPPRARRAAAEEAAARPIPARRRAAALSPAVEPRAAPPLGAEIQAALTAAAARQAATASRCRTKRAPTPTVVATRDLQYRRVRPRTLVAPPAEARRILP